jgi:protein TonB
MLTLRRFLWLSLTAHFLVLVMLYSIPLNEHQKAISKPYFIRIIREQTALVPRTKTIKPKEYARPQKTKPVKELPPPEASSEVKTITEAKKESGLVKLPPAVSAEAEKPSAEEKAPEIASKGKAEAGRHAFPGGQLQKLFDREVIGMLAKKHMPPVEDGVTFSTREFKYYGYMMRLKEKIEGVWRYPEEAASKGIYGDLYIRFVINKDGSLGDVELLRTSGKSILDEAALQALQDAAPYWPLPESWQEDTLTITGHFVYSLYGIYIR